MSVSARKTEYGLIERHQYTTIATKEYNGEQLIKLRNPWGREEYTGPWSDSDSAKWTVEARNTLGNHPKADDGTFWMAYKDFHRIFDDCVVGMYSDWKRDVKKAYWDRVHRKMTRDGIAYLT